MTNLNERLEKHLQSIREEKEEIINDLAKVKDIITKKSSHLDKSTSDCYKAMLDCCKSGKFIPSTQLEKVLVEWGVEFVEMLMKSGDDIEEAIDDLLDSEPGQETFWDEMLRYISMDSKLYHVWYKGIDYITDKMWDKMGNKVEARLKVR